MLMAGGSTAVLSVLWGLYGSPSQPASKKGKKDSFHFLLNYSSSPVSWEVVMWSACWNPVFWGHWFNLALTGAVVEAPEASEPCLAEMSFLLEKSKSVWGLTRLEGRKMAEDTLCWGRGREAQVPIPKGSDWGSIPAGMCWEWGRQVVLTGTALMLCSTRSQLSGETVACGVFKCNVCSGGCV